MPTALDKMESLACQQPWITGITGLSTALDKLNLKEGEMILILTHRKKTVQELTYKTQIHLVAVSSLE